MTRRYRPYTGNPDHAASLARLAAEWTEREIPELTRRIWTEDNAETLVVQNAMHLRESIARMQRALAEIEAIVTTVTEEQDAAKEKICDAA